MRIKAGGKYYELHFTRLKGKAWGYCDAPDKPRKRIWIHNRMNSVHTLEVVIHEMMHAQNWTIDEKHIEKSAHEIAVVLDKLGFKRNGIES